MQFGPWAGKKYFLDKMTFADLVKAYFTHYSVLAYLALTLVGGWFAVAWNESALWTLLAAAAVIPIYPPVEYLLHRYVLHGKYLYKWPGTAKLWKRIHYDHHQDPNDLSVLFGALHTTMPVIVVVALPVGWLIGGTAGSAAAFGSACLVTAFYEFCHSVHHLPFQPKWEWLRRLKKQHLAHHFHSELGNYGITSSICDRLLGSYYPHPKQIARSETVHNLGYTEAEAERYPWVAALTPEDPKRNRRSGQRLAAE